jgi:ABC-2 type transport system permease protein
MKTLRKYGSIFYIYYKTSIIRDVESRFNFIMGVIGAFCYVALNYFLITFLFDRISIGRWTDKEILVLLGNFYIIWYTIFFLFYRGYVYLIRYIRTGLFDFYLVKPADTQFLVSVIGGGVHNLIAVIFGLIIVIYGLINLGIIPSPIALSLWIITMVIAILDSYAFILLLVTLNFKYGYLEEILFLAFSIQEFSRYPIDAFVRMSMLILLLALPFSALATVPTMLLIDTSIPYTALFLFYFISVLFLIFSRQMWTLAIRSYSSSS